jgi:hypothetical protein
MMTSVFLNVLFVLIVFFLEYVNFK